MLLLYTVVRRVLALFLARDGIFTDFSISFFAQEEIKKVICDLFHPCYIMLAPLLPHHSHHPNQQFIQYSVASKWSNKWFLCAKAMCKRHHGKDELINKSEKKALHSLFHCIAMLLLLLLPVDTTHWRTLCVLYLHREHTHDLHIKRKIEMEIENNILQHMQIGWDDGQNQPMLSTPKCFVSTSYSTRNNQPKILHFIIRIKWLRSR